MQTQIAIRQQVIDLAMTMPLEKLINWYEYGLFIRERPLYSFIDKTSNAEEPIAEELASWEAASDEDWVNFENELMEMT